MDYCQRGAYLWRPRSGGCHARRGRLSLCSALSRRWWQSLYGKTVQALALHDPHCCKVSEAGRKQLIFNHRALVRGPWLQQQIVLYLFAEQTGLISEGVGVMPRCSLTVLNDANMRDPATAALLCITDCHAPPRAHQQDECLQRKRPNLGSSVSAFFAAV